MAWSMVAHDAWRWWARTLTLLSLEQLTRWCPSSAKSTARTAAVCAFSTVLFPALWRACVERDVRGGVRGGLPQADGGILGGRGDDMVVAAARQTKDCRLSIVVTEWVASLLCALPDVQQSERLGAGPGCSRPTRCRRHHR